MRGDQLVHIINKNSGKIVEEFGSWNEARKHLGLSKSAINDMSVYWSSSNPNRKIKFAYI